MGIIDHVFWASALEDKREFFLLSFLMLLCPHGRYGLHANCVVKEKTGLLIVGGSGCGKTTLTVGLLSAGWSYLADDALMLRRVSRGIEALALRRGISCTPQTAAYFPELRITDQETPVLAEGKRWVAAEPLCSGRFSHLCFPRILLFPQVTARKHSQLMPLDETRAMIGLIQQSPGIMCDKPLVRKQLETLSLLINQSISYQLLVGTDVYEDPTAVSNLLWESRKA
jgi:ABC-type Fe3+/spermidine/putrescine transport system ATPase subunit